MTFSITREHIRLEAVTGEKKNGVGIITIRNFTESSGITFATVAQELLKKKVTSFVIDVRDNPGGYLTSSLEMLDEILPEKTRLASLIFAEREVADEFLKENPDLDARGELDPQKPEVIFYSKGKGELGKYPIDVLINGGSASASEILAASLKENGVARLIGEKSFGKGTVQEMSDYGDGSLYKQTIGKWQTPNENNLTENPIQPDIEMKDNQKTEQDEVLEYAISN
jgi:carboxyl-terminal processing protease